MSCYSIFGCLRMLDAVHPPNVFTLTQRQQISEPPIMPQTAPGHVPCAPYWQVVSSSTVCLVCHTKWSHLEALERLVNTEKAPHHFYVWAGMKSYSEEISLQVGMDRRARRQNTCPKTQSDTQRKHPTHSFFDFPPS